MTLEERITRLEDIEAIRQLQAKYQRCLDTRDFAGLEECFTIDAVSSYDSGDMTYKGRDAILGFLRGAMTCKIPSSHLIHGGEIDICDCTHAHAKWYLEDFLLHRTFLMKLHGAAIYDVGYVKEVESSDTCDSGCGETGCGGTGCGETGCGETGCGGTDCGETDCGGTGCGGWKINSIGYTRCYEYFEFRGLLNLLTLGKTSFLDAYKKAIKKKR